MIYFARLSTGAIKIGFSDNVDRRLGSLKGIYGDELTLLHTMEGDRQTEREIHERFSDLRFGKTEQFRPAAELMEFMGKPLLVSANPDTIEAAEQLKLVRLELPPAYHRDLRVIAAKQDTTMAVLSRKLLMEFIDQQRKAGKV